MSKRRIHAGAAIIGAWLIAGHPGAAEPPPDVVVSIEVFPGRIRADMEEAPIRQLIRDPALAGLHRSVRDTLRRVLSLQDGVGEPMLDEVAALWAERLGFHIWRRTLPGDPFGAVLAAVPADPVGARDLLDRLPAVLREGGESAAVVRLGERIGAPLSASIIRRHVVATQDEALLADSERIASAQPPAGEIWARLRVVPEPWIRAMENEPAAFAAATWRNRGIDCVRCVDATLRWDPEAQRFVSMVFVRLQGGPIGWLSVPGEAPPNPDVLRSVPAASAGAAIARLRPAEFARLCPAWLPDALAAAFEGTVAAALHRDTPDAPPQFTVTLLLADPDLVRAREAAVLREKTTARVFARDLRGRATLYTERVADADGERPGWSWVVLDDRVILGRNPFLVARAAVAAIEDRPNLSSVPEFSEAWQSRAGDAVGLLWTRHAPVVPRTARNAALALARLARLSPEGVVRACAAWIVDALECCEGLPNWLPAPGLDGSGRAALRRTPEGFLLETAFPLPPGLLAPALLPEPVVRALAGE